jgi:hypothetical protein
VAGIVANFVSVVANLVFVVASFASLVANLQPFRQRKVNLVAAALTGTPHASPEMLAVLLDACARVDTVSPFPSGSAAADALLREHGRAG